MSDLRLVFAGGDYDRTRPLADGTVRPEGIDLTYLPLPVEEVFFRMSHYQDFDVAEAGLTTYIIRVAQGTSPVVAIPAFPSRSFRHGCIFVHARAGIREPTDLRGKRVGVPTYTMAAAVWIRALLEHEYGVPPSELDWYQGGLTQPGRQELVRLELPPGVRLRVLGPDQTLDAMLAAGELDALVTARIPPCFERGDAPVQRLFPDFRTVEQAYYRKTGLFPIMHCVVLKRSLYEAHPWVAPTLLKALDAAKREAYETMYDHSALRYGLPWLVAELEETRRLMGPDPWPYGVEPNRAVLDAACQYIHEQGLTRRRVSVDELFAPNTLSGYHI